MTGRKGEWTGHSDCPGVRGLRAPRINGSVRPTVRECARVVAASAGFARNFALA